MWEEESEQKNPRCGRRRREASWKNHSGSLSMGLGEKSDRGKKSVCMRGKVSKKTHVVCFWKEKQAEKHTPEANRCEQRRKVCV